MSLTTVRQSTSCLYCREEIQHYNKHKTVCLAWQSGSHHYQIWGAISNCKKKRNLAAKMKKKVLQIQIRVCTFDSYEPWIWPACIWQHQRWSLCERECGLHGRMQPECCKLSSAATASHLSLSSLLLQVPLHLKYFFCLLSFLSACLCWRPQGRNIFQGMYVYTSVSFQNPKYVFSS